MKDNLKKKDPIMLFFFSFFFKVREQKSNDWRVNEKGKKKSTDEIWHGETHACFLVFFFFACLFAVLN